MRCKKARGDTTLADAGRYATQGERKRASVVACAISSTEPGSGVSGALDCAHDRRGASASRLSSNSGLSSISDPREPARACSKAAQYNFIEHSLNYRQTPAHGSQPALRHTVRAGEDRTGHGPQPLLRGSARRRHDQSEEHTSELQSQSNLVCRLLLEKKKKKLRHTYRSTKIASPQYII